MFRREKTSFFLLTPWPDFVFKQSCINLSSLKKFMWHEELGRVSSATTWLEPYFTRRIFRYVSEPQYSYLHIFINRALRYRKWRIIIWRNEAWNNVILVLGKNMLSKTPIRNGDKSPAKFTIYFLILCVNYLFAVIRVPVKMELES
jgi:hypothetical protein